jgi:segregation and condensation protein A
MDLMPHQAYQVQLSAFQGPLDLLLHLIEQQELDITTISLAQVTDQYLDYLASADVAPDELTDFVTIAARLLLIKSRTLLPRPPKTEEEEEDVGEDLVRQLREYKRFKQIGQLLEQRDSEGLHTYPRPFPDKSWLENASPWVGLSGVALDDLAQSLHKLLSERAASDPEFRIVPYQVTIDDKIGQIAELLHGQNELTFDDLVTDGSRIAVVVTFLAVLEMIRHHQIAVSQKELFGEIVISLLNGA